MTCSHCPTTRRIEKTDKKVACIELCGGVDTAQRQASTQLPTGFYANLLVSVSVSVDVSVSVSGSVNTPLGQSRSLRTQYYSPSIGDEPLAHSSTPTSGCGTGTYGVITPAVSGTGTGTGTRTMGENRCWFLSLFRCSVKGSM